jgi:hypothetical protein
MMKQTRENKLVEALELKADLIEVTVKGTFITEHMFRAPDGVLGILTINSSKGEGKFLGNDDGGVTFKKPSFWKNNYELYEGSSPLAAAHPPKKLSRAFEIDFKGEVFHLAPGGTKMRSWTMANSQGQRISEILPRGVFKRGAYLKIGAAIPLYLLVFGYYLVIRRWQEEAGAAVS